MRVLCPFYTIAAIPPLALALKVVWKSICWMQWKPNTKQGFFYSIHFVFGDWDSVQLLERTHAKMGIVASIKSTFSIFCMLEWRTGADSFWCGPNALQLQKLIAPNLFSDGWMRKIGAVSNVSTMRNNLRWRSWEFVVCLFPPERRLRGFSVLQSKL